MSEILKAEKCQFFVWLLNNSSRVYRFAFNNPVSVTDPDGNLETSIYNSSTSINTESGFTFNNGSTDVSSRVAAYSVGYFDFYGQASGEYRQRVGSEETGRIFNYKGDPNNYDTYDIGKVAPTVDRAGLYLGDSSVLVSGIDYSSYITKGGSIISPETLLFAGDVLVNQNRLTSASGFFLTVGWEAGKALGRYKNYLEKKWPPGGLDGLIPISK
jgi:hypothetical protein